MGHSASQPASLPLIGASVARGFCEQPFALTLTAPTAAGVTRTNLSLSPAALESGRRAARDRKTSLSGLVEKHLLAFRSEEGEHFSPYHGKPAPHCPGDKRHEYLSRKHA